MTHCPSTGLPVTAATGADTEDQVPQFPLLIEEVFVTVPVTVTVLVLVVVPATGVPTEDQAVQLPSAPVIENSVSVTHCVLVLVIVSVGSQLVHVVPFTEVALLVVAVVVVDQSAHDALEVVVEAAGSQLLQVEAEVVVLASTVLDEVVVQGSQVLFELAPLSPPSANTTLRMLAAAARVAAFMLFLYSSLQMMLRCSRKIQFPRLR